MPVVRRQPTLFRLARHNRGLMECQVSVLVPLAERLRHLVSNQDRRVRLSQGTLMAIRLEVDFE